MACASLGLGWVNTLVLDSNQLLICRWGISMPRKGDLKIILLGDGGVSAMPIASW